MRAGIAGRDARSLQRVGGEGNLNIKISLYVGSAGMLASPYIWD